MLYVMIDCDFCNHFFEEQVELSEFGEIYPNRHTKCPECDSTIEYNAELEINLIDSKVIRKGMIFCKDCHNEIGECECRINK